MYAYNHGTGARAHVAPQGYAPSPTYGTAPGYASNPAYAPPPGYVTTALSAPTPLPAPGHAPTPPLLSPVQVPPGHYPIELVQFWRDEHRRGQPFPLHWAFFVRTTPRAASPGHGRQRHPTTATTTTPRGNFYELVGTTDTYTAQFMSNVSFEPDALADWRGTHVIGWVSPGQLTTFEAVARQVPVWRHRPEWRCQQWVYEVVKAVGGNYQGVFMDVVTFGGLQRQMGRLLEAWENGDI